MSNMPLMIDLQNKKIVIVGGGKVATRRAKSIMFILLVELHTLFQQQRVTHFSYYCDKSTRGKSTC